jgi:predicted amidohydrolase
MGGMRDIRIAAVQFEHKSADREFNLARIDALTADAARRGAEVVSFHECAVTGYTFLQSLSREQLIGLAEEVPDGPSTERLIAISRRHGASVLAGLLEREGDRVYNTYVCVSEEGFVAKHRKMHVFVNPHLSPGDKFTVFDLAGCRCGILICYDNNLVENVRITALMGAQIIFMPHVTGCLPSAMPGRGFVSPELWHNRDRDPVRLRQEFDGPKGRAWLMRWLPARAYDNGIYAVFSNPIGMDDDQVRNGNAMILDPFGEILAECTSMGDEVALALCTADKLDQSSGYRFRRARRPDLYGKLVEPSAEPPVTRPGWKLRYQK